MSFKRILQIQYRVEAGVMTLAYAATALSLLGDVVGRELFSEGIWGAPRFAVYAAIVAGFLGMSLAAADGAHIRPQLLDFVVPSMFDQLANRIADLVSCGIYFVLGYLSVSFVWVSYENADITPVLDWQLWPIQLILPYTFFSVSFRYLVYVIQPNIKTSNTLVEVEG
jgi:TRAP-type C4-dicarboxylate transport system permease small subunit